MSSFQIRFLGALFFCISICGTLFSTVVVAPVARAEDSPSEESSIVGRINFGTVLEGDTFRHTFSFRNSADFDVIVHQVVSSCGCISALANPVPVKKGGSLPIPVEFFSAGLAGGIWREIKVFTSNPELPEFRYIIEGVVTPKLLIKPLTLTFGSLRADRPSQEQILTIEPHPSVKSAIKARTLHPNVKIRRLKNQGRLERFGIKLIPPLAPGEFRGAVSVSLLGKVETLQPRVVPVSATVLEAISLSQPTVSFGDVSRSYLPTVIKKIDGKLVRSVDVELLGTDIRDIDVQASDAALGAKLFKAAAGKSRLEVTLDPKALTVGDLDAAVTLSADEFEDVVLRVLAHKR